MRTKFAFLTTFLLLLLALPSYLRAEPATNNLAGVVVDLGGGQVQTYCIAFAEEQISGFEALQRTGLPIELDVSGMGAAVCQIGQTGCPGTNCFCQCPGGSNCNYWSYWHLTSGNWQYAQGGASTYMVRHGMVDGWVWGAGGSGNASPPVSTSFEQVCSAQLPATPTPTVLPTATPLPTATATATVLPTSTAAPPIVQFSAVAPAITSGVCTELVWDVQHVQAVYLDGVGVSGQGRQQVCPPQTAVYHLRVVYATGEQVAQVTVNVTAATSTPLATQTATAVPAAIAPAGGAIVPTAVPSATPIPPTPTAETPPDTPPPATDEPLATREIVMVQVPLAHTATPLALEVAQVLPTAETLPTAAPLPAFSAEPAPVPFDWLGYGVFALLAIILGIMLFFVRR